MAKSRQVIGPAEGLINGIEQENEILIAMQLVPFEMHNLTLHNGGAVKSRR